MYMPLFLQVDSSLNFLTQSIQFYTNVAIAIKDFIGSSRVNYICMASSQSKFVLPGLLTTLNLSKYKKALYFLYKGKKVSHSNFYKDEWFLNSSASTLLF